MAIKEGQTATNPRTGEKVVYRAGSWQALAGPQPVALSTQEEQQMNALRDTAIKSSNTDQQVQRFGKLNEQVSTGFGRGGGGFNPLNWFNGPNLQAMESITSALAPTQRVPGSGSSSDKDVEMFRKGLPSIDKFGGANAKIIDNLHNQAVQDRARVSFYDKWVQQHGTLNGAPEAFQQQLDAIQNAPNPQVASALVRALTGQAPMTSPQAAPATTPRVQPPKKASTKLVYDPATGDFK
ncbi:MAG: hypothetical protein NVV72_15790 [Asticcacaulis sp.]|nr:hypothetical protein [Asticcacaulis sp.]